METIYQVSLQIILLLFTQTNTPTTGGLERFFSNDSFFGVQVNPTTFLLISVTWSIKTCILLHLKTIRVEKGFFRFKAQLAALMWVVFGTIRNVSSIIVFFTPSLGLFSLLHHWQAENIPFKARLDLARKMNNPPDLYPQYKWINLYNMTEEVSWSSLDRWRYEDPHHPVPPSYSIYTGMTLQQTFFAFIGIFIFQMVAIFIAKSYTSDDFSGENCLKKFTHIIHTIYLPVPFKDWDSGKLNSVQIFKARYRRTEIEMGIAYLINSCFTLTMMIPLFVTGR